MQLNVFLSQKKHKVIFTKKSSLNMLFAVLLLCFTLQSNAQNKNVTLLGKLNPHASTGYNDIWGYVTPTGEEYALLGVKNGMSVIDINDLNNINEVAFFSGSNSVWWDMKVYKTYAYAVNESGGGMMIVDLSPLPNGVPVKVKNFTDFSTSHNVFIDEPTSRLYVESKGQKKVVCYDITDPINPVQISSFSPECHDFWAEGDFCWVSEGNRKRVVKYNVLTGATVSSFNFQGGGYVHNNWPTEDRKYMITTEETSGKKLRMWDVSDENNITEVDQIIGASDVAHNAFIHGDFAYISHYASGLEIFDVSDPTNMVAAGNYDTHTATSGMTGCWGVYPFFPSGKIIAADVKTGLWIFDFEGDKNPPKAGFSASKTIICKGSDVNFSDKSSGNPQSWEWSFEGGVPATSTNENPTVAYSTTGVFKVTLKVVNQYGDDTKEQTSYISVNQLDSPILTLGSVCSPGGDVTLSASTTQVGTTVHWFDTQTSTTPLFVGSPFITNISASTVFYAQTINGESTGYVGLSSPSGSGGTHSGNQYNIFDAHVDLTIKTVLVKAFGSGDRIFELKNSSGTVIQSKTVNLPDGESNVTLDFVVPTGNDYQLGVGKINDADASLFRNKNVTSYPFVLNNVLTIKKSTANGNSAKKYYYYCYNWEIVTGGGGCSSEKIPAEASVKICLGVDNIDESNEINRLVVYPNPSRGKVYVESKVESGKIIILDNTGKVIEQRGVNLKTESFHLSSGFYIVELTTEESTLRTKLVVE